jgi:ATP phosphoribosyltransferase
MPASPSHDHRPLTLAVPKGRVLKSVSRLLESAGLDVGPLLADDRTLIRETADGSLRFLLLKPDDVPTYVEYGAADLGVSGQDVLRERRYDLYEPLDLGIGRCRMVVAAKPDALLPPMPRIATKYRRAAAEHFAAKGVQADIVYVQGSVELAPIVGLADAIVDIVETGTTLAENGLVEHEVISTVSSVLIANRAQFKLRHAEVTKLISGLKHAIA